MRESAEEAVSVADMVNVRDKCAACQGWHGMDDSVRYMREYFHFTRSICLRCTGISLHFGCITLFTSNLQ